MLITFGAKNLLLDSKLGNNRLAHLHDWLHVRFEQTRHNCLVERACFCGFVLHFVDVSVLVPDRRWDMLDGFIEALNEGDHLGSQ